MVHVDIRAQAPDGTVFGSIDGLVSNRRVVAVLLYPDDLAGKVVV